MAARKKPEPEADLPKPPLLRRIRLWLWRGLVGVAALYGVLIVLFSFVPPPINIYQAQEAWRLGGIEIVAMPAQCGQQVIEIGRVQRVDARCHAGKGGGEVGIDGHAYTPCLCIQHKISRTLLMRVRDKGPIWIIYPLSDYPALRKEEHHHAMVWQLKALSVSR